MYKQHVDGEKAQEAVVLDLRWRELVQEAKLKDNMLQEVKKHFAKVTQSEVAEFQFSIKSLFEQYQIEGPGSPEITLDKGLQLLEEYKAKTLEFNKKKDGLILAEKLFNLPISTFPELVSIEQENKKMQVLYSHYSEIKGSFADWSSMLWSKLDSEVLKVGADKFDKLRKKLANEYNGHPTYEKLSLMIKEFKDSIPLIQQLKYSQISERHWEKLMKNTGTNFDLNVKSLTLENVFKLNLQNYPDMVTEICTEASNEAKNEEEISKIEQVWKSTNFELSSVIKGGEETFVLKSNEEVKMLLEDQLTNLQQVASSKYVAAFLKRVRHWEQALNRISETIDQWFIVQKKWIYLEGIFTGSDDIR